MQKKAPETARAVPFEVDFGAYRIADPEEFNRNMLRLVEEGSKALSGYLERANGKSPAAAGDFTEASKLFGEIAQSWLGDPGKLVEAQGSLVHEYLQLAS